LIEVVTLEDLKRLRELKDERPDREEAFIIITDIVQRLHAPHAYLIRPMYPEETEVFWRSGYDILTATLIEQGYGVIEPETLRALTAYSAPLYHMHDFEHPFLKILTDLQEIDEFWFPQEEEKDEYRQQLLTFAHANNVSIRFWKPQWITVRRQRPSSV
jgi:hypothetical protein